LIAELRCGVLVGIHEEGERMSDSVNDYGLGAPNTQDPTADTGLDTGPDRDVDYGLGPTDGPFEGESASEEEGTRYGLGDENTQQPTADNPYGVQDPALRDPDNTRDPL
jgi:hypothetical protein